MLARPERPRELGRQLPAMKSVAHLAGRGIDIGLEHAVIRVRRSASNSGRCLARRLCCIAVIGLGPAAGDRVAETTGGLPMMTVEITVVFQCRGGLAPAVGLTRPGFRRQHLLPEAVSRRDWVPRLPGGDHGVQVPQDRRRDDGLGLGGRELVQIPAGQVLVEGPVDRLAVLDSPRRPPCGQPQPRPALAGSRVRPVKGRPSRSAEARQLELPAAPGDRRGLRRTSWAGHSPLATVRGPRATG
jgi:hypothetical protein